MGSRISVGNKGQGLSSQSILVAEKNQASNSDNPGAGLEGVQCVEGVEGWRASGKALKGHGVRKLAQGRRGAAGRGNSIAGGKATQPVRGSVLIQIRSV